MEIIATKKRLTRARSQKKYTKEEFYRIAERATDGMKYEFLNGEIEKYNKMMTINLFVIYDNFQNYFVNSGLFASGFKIYPEKELAISDSKIRVPDISVYTKQQIDFLKSGINAIPHLLIEIASKNDTLKQFEIKLSEYFELGVQMVWWIEPDFQLIYVFKSLKIVKIYSGDDICPTVESIPDFKIVTSDIFKK